MNLLSRSGLAMLVLAGISTAALAQSTNPRPAPQWILNALKLTQATVQDLQIPAERQTFQFQVEIAGQLMTVEVQPNDIRTADFKLLVDDGTQIRELPRPASVTFIGRVLGHLESRVAASVVDQKMRAVISLDDTTDEVWGIESVAELDLSRPIDEYAVYTTHDANVPGTTCGADDTQWQPIGMPGLDTTMKIAEIAIDCDLEYYQRAGSSVTTATSRATTLVNAVSAIYQRDVEIQYLITTIIVRTTRTYTNTDMRNLLPEFRSRWNAQHGSVRRDVAHLFTGKGSFSGIVGIAYLGVICNISNSYGVDKAFASLGTNTGLVSHELGHNWNAPHCDASSPCRIMCSGLGGCSSSLSSFAPVSISTIVSFKNSRNCLDNAVSQPSITGINPTTTVVMPRSAVTLTGNNFNGVTAVNVGSLQVAPASVTNTVLTFLPPSPPAFGTYPVSVVNSAGTSNSVALSFTQVSPGFYTAQPQAFSGGTISFAFAGDPNDNWWVLAAFNNNNTLPFLGFNILTNSLALTSGSLNGIGIQELLYQVPSVSLQGVVMYSQVVMLEETAPALNWVSNVLPTIFFF